MPSSDAVKDDIATALCLRCGLCCDGSVFHSVVFKPDEQIEQIPLLDITLDDDGERVSRQPCPAFVDHKCAVYSVRPQSCRNYRCVVLQQVQAGEMTFDIAITKVTETRQLAHKVKHDLATWLQRPHSSALPTLLREFAARWAVMDAAQRKAVDPALLLAIGAAQATLQKYFNKDGIRNAAATQDGTSS